MTWPSSETSSLRVICSCNFILTSLVGPSDQSVPWCFLAEFQFWDVYCYKACSHAIYMTDEFDWFLLSEAASWQTVQTELKFEASIRMGTTYKNLQYCTSKVSPAFIVCLLYSLLNLRDLLFTQCLSSTGFPKPSPSKTWPRWPPQFLHVISVLFIPIEVCITNIRLVFLFRSQYPSSTQPEGQEEDYVLEGVSLCSMLYRWRFWPCMNWYIVSKDLHQHACRLHHRSLHRKLASHIHCQI